VKKIKPIPFLKVDIVSAVEILDECILAGYKLKDEIAIEYNKVKQRVTVQEMSDWQSESRNWVNNCLNKLQQIYVSPREAYNFRDVKTTRWLISSTANKDYVDIIDMFEAKIKLLNDYLSFILQRPNVLFYSKRDLFVQFGSDSKQEVKN